MKRNTYLTLGNITVVFLGGLCNRYMAVIDTADLPLIYHLHWSARRVGHYGHIYAAAVPPGCENGKQHKVVLLHRVILNPPVELDVDHRLTTLDNRRRHIRVCLHSQNMCSRRAHRTLGRTSRFKGVSWVRRDQRWRALIFVNGRQRHLGNFTSEETAAMAYDAAARMHHGEFGRYNFPLSGEASALHEVAQ